MNPNDSGRVLHIVNRFHSPSPMNAHNCLVIGFNLELNSWTDVGEENVLTLNSVSSSLFTFHFETRFNKIAQAGHELAVSWPRFPWSWDCVFFLYIRVYNTSREIRPYLSILTWHGCAAVWYFFHCTLSPPFPAPETLAGFRFCIFLNYPLFTNPREPVRNKEEKPRRRDAYLYQV